MKRFEICCLGVSAIALLVNACQPNSPTSVPEALTNKAVTYLRSQLNLPTSIAINKQEQTEGAWSQSDLCQTTAPTRPGFQIVLLAENSRYILHTDRDGSSIELCASEDARSDDFAKYTGAGYTVKYPNTWQAIDEGIKPTGANRVRFSDPNGQSYVVIERSPQASPISEDMRDVKDLKTELYDVSAIGAKSGIEQTYTKTTSDNLEKGKVWQVKVLLINIDDFIYKIQSFEPANSTSSDKTFEQFANSFRLIK